MSNYNHNDYDKHREILIDPVDDDADDVDSRRRGNGGRTAIVVLFTIIFILVIAAAVWVFMLGDQGLMRHHGNPADQLAAPSAPPSKYVFVGVSLSEATVSLEQGERRMLTASLRVPPESGHVNTRALKLVWRSENPGVVQVDQHGGLIARGLGTARIAVTVNDDNIDSNTAYCMVTVATPKPYAPAFGGNRPDSVSPRAVKPDENKAVQPKAETVKQPEKPVEKKENAPAAPKTDKSKVDVREQVRDAFSRNKK